MEILEKIEEIKEIKKNLLTKEEFFKLCEFVCNNLELSYIILSESESEYRGVIYVTNNCTIDELKEFKGKLANVNIYEYSHEYEPREKYYKTNQLKWYSEKINKKVEKYLNDMKESKNISEKIRGILKQI